LTNPKIRDAAVVGVPDEDAGELPLAFVVTDSGVVLTEVEVKQFIEGENIFLVVFYRFLFLLHSRTSVFSKTTTWWCYIYNSDSEKSQRKNS
jgi:acyl-CoA synthetase (AMP-forming)/AMP-acid ligase II